MRSRKHMTVFIAALVLVAGMVSCENWMIEQLLDRNEPSGGGGSGGGGSVERVEITNGTERGGGEGSALVIKTEVYPANATNRDVKWSSEDSDIAEVVGTANGATVHLLKVGSTKIRVKPADGGKEAVCVITVIPAGSVVDVTGVKVYPTSLLLGMGESSTLMAQVLPGHATDHGIGWNSSDESVVKVDTNGIVTALKSGSATVTATSDSDSSKYGECLVTVNQFVFMKGGIIPSGYLWAAASTSTGDRSADTVPVGSTISVAPFHISETEVRYELWYEVKKWGEGYGYKFDKDYPGRAGNTGVDGAEPITDDDKNQPVAKVGWPSVVVWCNAYSEMTGKEAVYYDSTGTILLRDATVLGTVNGATQQDRNGYRLPKEKEWEYAARGGVPSDATGSAWKYSYAGSNTIDDVAWYNITANSKTHPVREKSANSAGLYDMSGNVWEWCFDPSGGGYRVARGGGWDVSPSNCLVAYRQEYFSSGSAFVTQGFRLVCR